MRGLRGKKFQHRLVCGVRLIGGKNMARLRNHYKFRTGNSLRNQFAIFRGYELICFTMDHECWSSYLRDAAVRFPYHDALQLSEEALGRNWPLQANFHVFIDSRLWRSFVI